MQWQIRIQDPSGETRFQRARNFHRLGRGESASVVLRDPTVPSEAATLWAASEPESANAPFWIRVPDGAPPVLLADIPVKEALLPPGLPVRIGESRVTIEPVQSRGALPGFPRGVRPWLTRSDEGRHLLWAARKAATTPLSIYIAGETGTGKEVLAHLLHAWSDRASGPFVPLHCGALPLSLAESELFGHVKGAFTGATYQRPGALMQAHGGTLFLDEVGDLPLDIQVKLLRFLENGEIRPVGADVPSRANVRLLCATHHSLLKLVEEGKFRRDLFYRVASVTIEIPPLRIRPADIEILAERFALDLGRVLSGKALLRLEAHSWPGNVRELRHAIERASSLAGPFSPSLGEECFSFLMSAENITRAAGAEVAAPVLTLQEMERVLLLRSLKLTDGNRAKAAKLIGVARSTMFQMLKRHKILGPRGKSVSN